jgi:hypothetical protein
MGNITHSRSPTPSPGSGATVTTREASMSSNPNHPGQLPESARTSDAGSTWRHRTDRRHSRLGMAEWALVAVIVIAVAVTIAMAVVNPS